MRLFVALPLPEEVRDALSDLQEGLPGARWVPDDNLHLTLRFIGEVDGGVARDIHDCLCDIVMPGFALSLNGLSTFGDGRNLRALYVALRSSPELLRLQTKVENAIVRAGEPPEPRKFKPHITLARFRRGDGGPPFDKMQDYLTRNARFSLDPIAVEGFTLFSSYLRSEGPIYTPEADYPLERPVAGVA